MAGLLGDGGAAYIPTKKNDVPAPDATDPIVQAKLDAASAEARRAKGRASTILTGGTGVTDAAPVSRRVLLGS